MSAEQRGILLVCAANVCRSPMAELTLRRAFGVAPGFPDVQVASAGVSAFAGSAVCAEVRDFDDSRQWSALAASHRSRPLEPDDVLSASLVLAASREVRAAVVAAAPEGRRRVFTLREAIWLGSGWRGASSRSGEPAVEAFARHIDGKRGLRPLPTPRRRGLARRIEDPLDIADGHQSRAGRHRATVRDVRAAADAIAVLIAGVRAPVA